jgi:hypothetical protein
MEIPNVETERNNRISTQNNIDVIFIILISSCTASYHNFIPKTVSIGRLAVYMLMMYYIITAQMEGL